MNLNTSLQFMIDKGYVLAVEDSLVQAKRLTHFFDEYKINYRLFPNAEEAYAMAIQEAPELIISDIIMPGMDGYEFCRKIKSIQSMSKIPVILLTSLKDPQDIIKGLQAGADNFITKPYDDKYLFSRIQYLLINRDIRFSGSTEMVIELIFQGEKYQINSDKKQILDLLLSVYEVAIHRNDELLATKAQLEIANNHLKEANQDLESFSRTVSHDLKTPLNAIIGFTEILLEDRDLVINENNRECMSIINSSAWAMSKLITDLLEFSRSGKVEIEPRPVNLSQIAYEVISKILKPELSGKVKISIEDNLQVMADPKLIEVVLHNLFGNAIKYSSLKEAPEITFGKKDYFGKDLFYIKDNGAGFDMNQAHLLFQPFQRLHSEEEFIGTGVGLSTVHRIIEKHGGQIWAESEPGKGATFFFTL
jgi:hypothetical protein